MAAKQIEDYRPGYPRYSALVAAHDSFHICRRFSNIRARLLLLKQDKLAILEERLERIDKEERAALFLGSSRDDRNEERASVLAQTDQALADYDAFVERNRRMLGCDNAKPRDVQSLQNWVHGNACLNWEETKYLDHEEDLFAISSIGDNATRKLEAWVEDSLARWFQKSGKSTLSGKSRDTHVYIFSTRFITRLARVLIVSLIILLLSIPIIVCHSISNMRAKLAIIILSLIIHLAILSGLTTARTNELFLAGATYATVLIVFVSNVAPDIE